MTRPERRRQILEVAADIIAEDGPAALTMERLAKDVGVTKPIVYDHFPNAVSVIECVLEDGFASARDEIDSLLAADMSTEDRIRRSVQIAFDALSSQPAVLKLVASPLADPELERRRLELRQQRLKDMAQSWQGELGIDAETAEAVSAVTFGAVEEAGRQYVEHGARREILEPLIANVVTALLSSVGERSTRRRRRRTG